MSIVTQARRPGCAYSGSASNAHAHIGPHPSIEALSVSWLHPPAQIFDRETALGNFASSAMFVDHVCALDNWTEEPEDSKLAGKARI